MSQFDDSPSSSQQVSGAMPAEDMLRLIVAKALDRHVGDAAFRRYVENMGRLMGGTQSSGGTGASNSQFGDH